MAKASVAARRSQQVVALLRVVIGIFFLIEGVLKHQDPQFAVRLPSLLEHWAADNPLFFYQDLLYALVIPNAKFTAFMITWLEMGVGASFVLGAFMRYTIPVQAVLNLSYLMATFHVNPGDAALNGLLLVMALLLFWGQASTLYGVDQLLVRYFGDGKKTRASQKSRKSRKSRKKIERIVEELDDDDEDEDDLDEDDDVETLDLPQLARLRKKRMRV